MPIYQYLCEACGHELETLQKISEDPLKDCPACGNPALKKRVTAAAFRLKGTGWYETDFKNKEKTKAKDKERDKAKDKKPDAGKTADTEGAKRKSAKSNAASSSEGAKEKAAASDKVAGDA